jgi:glutathione S-transferase
MSSPVTVIGSYLSPYVRKVLACLVAKDVAYRIDPLVGFFGNDDFTAISPVRRIPVLIEDGFVLNDSSVICQYIEDSRPGPRLIPADPRRAARTRWIEEYADTRLADVLLWKLFYQVAIRPAIWGEKGDRTLTETVMREQVPEVLAYLESQAPAEGFLDEALGVGDIAVAAVFRNLDLIRFPLDLSAAPRLEAWLGRVWESAPFQALKPFEEACIRRPPAEHRAALEAAGAPLTEETWSAGAPRRGPMSVS